LSGDRTAHGDAEPSTLRDGSALGSSINRQGPLTAFALVVAWSGSEPERLGESLMIPTDADSDRRFVFGRGTVSNGDERLQLLRVRPGRFDRSAPLNNPWVSRKQLVFRVEPTREIRIQNIGRCKMQVNGAVTDGAVLRPGDVLGLKNQLLFYCTLREFSSKSIAVPEPWPQFADADADGIVGESPEVWEVRAQIAFLAARSGNVLLLGASGTGKELVAHAIHRLSARHKKQMLSRNAATFPEGLIDAELFGNVKDYPNAGMPARPGLIAAADGSTLFLDEIGELPSELQAHLLRVLDSKGEYQRLGEAFTRTSDFRLMAATNRPVEHLKSDLAARFPFRLTLPDLNVRREDVPLLARHLLRRAAVKDTGIARHFFDKERGEPRISPSLIERLLRQRYTTHVRELETLLWQSVATSSGHHLALTDQVREKLGAVSDAAVAQPRRGLPSSEEVRAALERNQGVQERVWRELGLRNRYVLKRLIKKFGLSND